MPKQLYSLAQDGQRDVEVSWKGMWRNVTVSLGGRVIGVIPDQKTLEKGAEFRLAEGSTLKVQLCRKLYATELQVLRNGQPLPGSASDPLTRVKTAAGLVYFVAGLNLLLGVLGLVGVRFVQQLGFGIFSIIFGLIFLVLGYFTSRMSSAALILAIALLALDGLLGFLLAAISGNTATVGGLFARIILMIPMFQGVGAIYEIKKKRLLARRATGGV